MIHTPKGAQHSLSCKSNTGRTLHVYTPKIKDLELEKLKFQSVKDVHLLDSLKLSQPTRLDSLKHLLQEIQSNSISTYSPRFMNQLFSGISPQMLLASDVIAQTKTTLATNEASPLFSKIESEVIQNLCRLIGWDSKQSEGVVVPGGSSANFMAIHCARQRLSPDSKKTGHLHQLYRINKTLRSSVLNEVIYDPAPHQAKGCLAQKCSHSGHPAGCCPAWARLRARTNP